MDYELHMSADFIFLGVNNFLVFCLFICFSVHCSLMHLQQTSLWGNTNFPSMHHHESPHSIWSGCSLICSTTVLLVPFISTVTSQCDSDFVCGKCESCSVVPNSWQPIGLYSPWNSPGQNTGVDSPSLLQGNFPTQGSNPGLPNCRWILYHLSH